ncbi:MAG: HsdR family type I site-specific deoxyribonuclease [Bacteroidales bacterium]|nr:HsdR family type I site-specific deoxyribonuclease [Bacteroidales bacterium]
MILSNDKKYTGNQGKALKLDEQNYVEEPFLQQLEEQGWDEVLRLNMHGQSPEDSYRSSFSELVLSPVLENSLRKINPFLTDKQLDSLVHRITTFNKSGLIESNKFVLDLLLENTITDVNEETGEISPTVKYIDFTNPTNNTFTAISQFKVKIPGTEHHIVPDIILFINGLPIVTVECKSPKVKDSMGEAIDQLMRYSEQRNSKGEGNQELFFYNQFVIITDSLNAKFGTITTHNEKHFYRWSDPYPKTLNELKHGKSSPNDQRRMVAGMLDKNNLLDIIQTFTIFNTNEEGKTIKIVGRYQQFKAVKKSVERLLSGKNKDERSGIIWHTQGSGKSLTMMFMVREMRLKSYFADWKIVFITDRTQLEDQLNETASNIGFSVNVADSMEQLRVLLSNDTPDMVMAMIHKFQEQDFNTIFPTLNESHKILTMTDEAHRSQYSLLGANLDKAIPNASRIAYTGTPIDKTEKSYGDYIDKYTMQTAIDDGVTLEIVYEGRTHNAEIPETEKMDKRFSDVFSEYKLTERLQILGYGTRNAYLEAKETIKEKAKDIIKHYTEYIFTNGFKAQIVANSREAAVRYKSALDDALKSEILNLEKNNPYSINIERLKKLETAVIVSGKNNDKPHLKAFTNKSYHDKSIKRFKKPFGSNEKKTDGNVGIIIVKSMLLTGFDAPIEQVLYLDTVIIAHNLLQAIARVNRVGPEGKDVGFVIDYVGVGHHLKRALDSYSERELKEITDALSNREESLKELKSSHKEIFELLEKHGLTDFSDPEAFFDTFYDEEIRFEYILAFQKLTSAFNNVLPQKEALDYFNDYKNLLEINILAHKHFHDDRLSMRGIPDKLRAIADDFLKSKGIDQKVAPISIMDDDFQKNVKKRKREKTKAAEVEHAIRDYIEVNINEDPELFASFSKALLEIFKNFKGNWKKIYEELEKLRKKIAKREKELTFGLDRKKQMPFFNIFKAEIFDNKKLSEDEISQNVNLTLNVFNLLNTELKLTGFWDAIPAQNKLKEELQKMFLSPRFNKLPNIVKNRKQLISRIMELAKTNHFKIIAD